MILFQHHHMTVSMDPSFFKTYELIRHAALFQDMAGQMIIACMVGGFTDNDPDRNAGKTGKLRCRILKDPARIDAGALRRQQLQFDVRRRTDLRLIMHRKICDPEVL